MIYIVERLLHSTVEWLALGYLVAAMLMTYFFDRINLYDMTTNIANSVERLHTYGYLVFDKKYRFMNANDFAKELFPEIQKWWIDMIVSKENSRAYQEIVAKLDEWKIEREDKTIQIGDKYMELSIHDIIYHDKKRCGIFN